MIEACRHEVFGLHEFLVAWFTAELENTDEAFRRIADALSPTFVFISPDGSETLRAPLLESIREDHGRESAFEIEIRNYRPREVVGDLAVVTYEEHQRSADATNARVSTAVFERSETAPEGVAWRHLHETSLPV